MAQYNVAANLRAESPIQTILNRQGQRDAHQINQANLRAAEIREPYIGQLLEGQVAQENRAQERWEVEKPFLKAQLQQDQEIRSQAIESQGLQLEQQERANQFEEDRASGLYSDEELVDKHGSLGIAYLRDKQELDQSAISMFADSLAFVRGAGTPEGRESLYQRVIKDAPAAVMEYFPETYGGNEKAFDQLLDTLQGRQLTADEANVRMLEKYADEDSPYHDPEMAMLVRDMLINGTRRGTSKDERIAEVEFPVGGITMYNAYHGAQEAYNWTIKNVMAKAVSMDPFDRTLKESMDYPDWMALADTPEKKRRVEQEWEKAKENAFRSAETYMPRAAFEYQQQRFAKYANDLDYNAFVAREVPSKPAEEPREATRDTATPKQTDTLYGKEYTVDEEYEIGGQKYIYRGNGQFEEIE
jgi:hypothetical protein